MSWDGGGNGIAWTDPLNWSADQLPTSADDVALAGAGNVWLNGATVSVKSLTASVPLAIDHATLNVVNGNATFDVESSIHAANLRVNGDLIVNDLLYLNLGYSNPASTLVIEGAVDRTIGGTGTIRSLTDDGTSNLENATQDGSGTGLTLTIGGDVSIEGQGVAMFTSHPGGAIVNEGAVSVGYWILGNWNLSLEDNGKLINHGTISILNDSSAINLTNEPGASIRVIAGVFSLAGDWDNDGTIATDTGATLNLGGFFTFDDIGVVERAPGDVVNLVGTLDNMGSTLLLDAETGAWNLYGTLRGGAYQGTGDNRLIPVGGTLDGVTVNSPLELPGTDLHIVNGLTLNAALTLGEGYNVLSSLYFDGSTNQTLDGNGTITSLPTQSFNNIINSTRNAFDEGLQLTVGADIEITGTLLQIYPQYTGGTIVNDGTLTASDWYIGSVSGTFVNNATVSADAFVYIANLQNSPGASVGAVDSALHLDGDNWHNDGSIALTDSTWHLRGNFAFDDLGSFTRTGTGTVHIEGIWDNTGNVLTVDNLLGDLYLDGDGGILGGVVQATGAHRLFARGGSLRGLTLDAPITVAQGNTLYIMGDLVLNSTLSLGDSADDSNGAIQFWSVFPQSILGSGNIVVAGEPASGIYNYYVENMPVTIGAGIEITGRSLSHFGLGPLVNDGTFAATEAGGTWSIGAGSRFENRGSVSVAAGAFMSIDNFRNETGHTTTVAPGAVLRLNGDSLDNFGTIDLNGSMLVDYTNSSLLSAVEAQVASGRAGGAWTGTGINSTSARLNPQQSTTLGVMSSADYESIHGPGATFGGQAVDASMALVKYTYYGDTDFSGAVDFDDYVRTDGGFNTALSGWINGDFDGSGGVDFDDYVLIDLAFNSQGAPL